MKYTSEQIDAMREYLWEDEWSILTENDLREMLFEGCEGWGQMSNAKIIACFKDLELGEEQENAILAS